MKSYTEQFINGEWVKGSSDKTIDNLNPYTEEKIMTISSANKEDLDRAYQSAQKTQPDWANTLPSEKQEILLKVAQYMKERKDEIIDWLVKESGSTVIKANVEFRAAYNIVIESATFPTKVHGQILPSNTPGKENRVYRFPKGVVGVIGPWNFPLHLALRSIAPALAVGNTVVVKAASETPVTSGLIIADLFEQAGLPKGALHVLVGRGSEIGDDFVTHPVPKVISFTGSTEVGKHIGELTGGNLKEAALELGGNNAMIVLDDANLEKAVKAAAFGKFLHQGQICMALNRVIIGETNYEDFVSQFQKHVEGLQVGDPSKEKTVVGPLINHAQIERIQKDIDESIEMGAKKIMGGKVEGNLMHPVILRDVTSDMPIAKNEIFGPVAVLMKAKNEEDAIEIANSSPYGLSGSVFTEDRHHGVEVAKKVVTGMIHINDQSVNDEAHVAFGGEKESGVGRFGGEWAIDKFTTVKWISVQNEYRQFPF